MSNIHKAHFISVPRGENQHGRSIIVLLQTNAYWEQRVLVYQYNGYNNFEKKLSLSQSGNSFSSYILDQITDYPRNISEKIYLIWILHKKSHWDPNEVWRNSEVDCVYQGSNNGIIHGGYDWDNYQRDQRITLGSKDSGNNTGNWNNAVVHFTYDSAHMKYFTLSNVEFPDPAHDFEDNIKLHSIDGIGNDRFNVF